MSQKGLAPILIVILIAALVGGYLIYQSQTRPTPPPQNNPVVTSQTPQTTLIPSTILDETTNWKIYKDEKNDIEFKYPNDWYAKPLSGWTFSIFLDNHPFEIPKGTEFMTSIQVYFNEVMNTTTNKKFFQEKTLDEGVKRISSLYDPKSIKINNLVVGGKKAIQISGVWGPGMLEGHYFQDTLIQMDDHLLIVSLTNKEFDNVYDKILSTFKFLP